MAEIKENRKKNTNKKKKEKWVRFRHRVVNFIFKPPFYIFLKIKYKVRIDRLKDMRNRPYLVLYNHQTPVDQFVLGMACPKPLYYVATEDIFSIGWLSKALIWAVNPIPIKKSGHDLRAVKNCLRVAKEGGSIALAPEGNRTYSGETCFIKPSVVKLVRSLGLPLAFFCFEGGYGKEPRWSDCVREGRMKLSLRSTYEPEDVAKLTDEQLYELIKKELYQDDSEYPSLNYHKNSAEYLERLIYVCPECGLSEFRSEGDTLTCEGCGLKVKYTEDRNFVKSGEVFIFGNVKEWYRFQEERISRLDLSQYYGSVIYEDTVELYRVEPYVRKHIISMDARLAILGDSIELDYEGKETDIPLDRISNMAACGRNKLNIYIGDEGASDGSLQGVTLQIKGGKRFNCVKYINLYNHYRNLNGLSDSDTLGGKDYAEFLGF